MGRITKTFVFALLLACSFPARAADPILMFLLSVAREMVFDAIRESATRTAPEPEAVVVYPGTVVRPDHLRQLIDDSFLYLSSAQRAEIFEALHEELMKPRNAAFRGPMIEYFAHRALQVRAAQLRLAQLSYREKEFLAQEFREEVKALPPDEVGQLRKVIAGHLLPVPQDLNALLLAALP